MPRYFFHLYDDVETLDLEGLELPNIDAARQVATHELRQSASYELQRDDRVDTASRIDIANESGRVLANIHFDYMFDS